LLQEDLERMLFEEPNGKSGIPLFASKKDLSQALLGQPAFQKRQLNSMQAYVSQVLKPHGEKHSRPVSKKFYQALLIVVSNRLSDSIDQLKFTKRIDSAIRNLKSEEYSISGADSALIEFWNKSDNAKEVFAITEKPAELYNTPTSNRLTRTLAQRTSLLPTDGEEVESGTYTFFILRDEQIGKDFWVNLYQFLQGAKQSGIRRKINECNKNERLRIFIWDPPFSYIPVCLFNPQEPDSSGFVLIHRESTVISAGHDICELSQSGRQNIISEIYYPYMLGIGKSDFYKSEEKKIDDGKPFLKEIKAADILGDDDD